MKRGHELQPLGIEWMLRGQLGERIPYGMITLLASPPGQGKSSFANWLTAEMTRQGNAVLHSNQEDALRQVLVPRLLAAGADMKRVYLPEEPILLPHDIDKLEKKIKEARIRFVSFDALAQHLAVSQSNDQEVRKALTPLAKMLARTNCACLLVTHTKMNGGSYSNPLDAIYGGGAGTKGAARAVYLYGPSPRDSRNRALVLVKNNIGMTNNVSTEFSSTMVDFPMLDPESGKVKQHKVLKLHPVAVGGMVARPMQILQVVKPKGADDNDMGDNSNPTRVAMAQEWLTGILRKGPMREPDIAGEATKIGISKITVRRAATALEIEKRFGGPKKGWSWDLPEAHPLRKRRKKLAAKTAAKKGDKVDEGLAALLGSG
ncbi:MAG TPA: AAA family ATPase [Gaiellaceae bacterium]|nr:AAA family ATPase [Gaiellaceae bacterium]